MYVSDKTKKKKKEKRHTTHTDMTTNKIYLLFF